MFNDFIFSIKLLIDNDIKFTSLFLLADLRALFSLSISRAQLIKSSYNNLKQSLINAVYLLPSIINDKINSSL